MKKPAINFDATAGTLAARFSVAHASTAPAFARSLVAATGKGATLATIASIAAPDTYLATLTLKATGWEAEGPGVAHWRTLRIALELANNQLAEAAAQQVAKVAAKAAKKAAKAAPAPVVRPAAPQGLRFEVHSFNADYIRAEPVVVAHVLDETASAGLPDGRVVRIDTARAFIESNRFPSRKAKGEALAAAASRAVCATFIGTDGAQQLVVVLDFDPYAGTSQWRCATGTPDAAARSAAVREVLEEANALIRIARYTAGEPVEQEVL